MKKDVLTLLGCSGSFALMLAANPATANSTTPLREIVFTAPEVSNVQQEVDTPVAQEDLALDNIDCSCANYDPQEEDFADSYLDDKEGDLAIQNLGCDCAGCRNIVRNWVSEGKISLQ